MVKKTPPILWEDIHWDRGAHELEAVLAGLPELQQQVLELYYEHGHRIPEIAEKLEIPAAKVRRQYHLALFHLRHHPNSTYFRGMEEAAKAHLKARNEP